ncbi:methyltransferase family protein [Spirosoma endbachense]|uniref:Isoprenylcysteine carboxylmethyltransferase family protein n=1 Tax=Spirosoma endbachense TaxID=2666025 RepID=A0A6P1VUA0_9BACT|nr:isoprenylcysteine carboxylmethyltransferase family protein [Spirosoma endbachense]QHV95672.1 isoprenylcysteine carboxylmethyltransferase family protein [Spirosoma endbachense]
MRPPSLLAHLLAILLLPVTVTIVIPWLIYVPHQWVTLNTWVVKLMGGLVGLAGFTLLLRTIWLFNGIGKGTLAPWEPPQRLVVVGPYRYCRNPMISGVLAMLLGEALLLQSGNLLLWAGLVFGINTVYFIGLEEPDLLNRFGTDYQHYKQHVPRWIPYFRPYQPPLQS